MNEGPQTRVIPQISYTTCLGCKYLESKLGRSGRNPLRNYSCKHPDAPKEKIGPNIAFMTDEDPTPPDFCPFLKV